MLILAVVVAIVVLAATALVLVSRHSRGASSAATGATPTRLVGHRLPDASFTRFDGTKASLSSLRGQLLVINFWSATCAPCRTEMPALQRIHQQVGRSVTFLGIDTGDGEATARAAAHQSGVRYPLALDPTGRIAAQIGAVALPTTVVVAPDGTVTAVHVGAVRPDQLSSWIARARP
jgi:peroxiredoxin